MAVNELPTIGTMMNVTETGRWGKEKLAKFLVFSYNAQSVRLEVTIDQKTVILNVPRSIVEEMNRK